MQTKFSMMTIICSKNDRLSLQWRGGGGGGGGGAKRRRSTQSATACPPPLFDMQRWGCPGAIRLRLVVRTIAPSSTGCARRSGCRPSLRG